MEEDLKKLLFSLIPGRDLVFKTLRAGGKGGQHQNKVETAVRLSHPASGVEIRVSNEKSQHRNKRIALRRLAVHKKFLLWVRVHAAMVLEGFRNVEEKVDKSMQAGNLRIEYITKYTCDRCKKKAKVISDSNIIKRIPPGWTEGSNGRTHYCPACKDNREVRV